MKVIKTSTKMETVNETVAKLEGYIYLENDSSENSDEDVYEQLLKVFGEFKQGIWPSFIEVINEYNSTDNTGYDKGLFEINLYAPKEGVINRHSGGMAAKFILYVITKKQILPIAIEFIERAMIKLGFMK